MNMKKKKLSQKVWIFLRQSETVNEVYKDWVLVVLRVQPDQKNMQHFLINTRLTNP